jgi:dihydrofolate reductase
VRRLGVVEFVTLDGVMQGFHESDEDRAAGFTPLGWGVPYADETQLTSALEELPSTTAYLFGRRTYEQMIRFWPHQPDENPMAAHLNRTEKFVATRTLSALTWSNAHVLDGDLAAGVASLKDVGEGFITVLGSGSVARQLADADLVDEYRLFVHPLLLGTGARLFGDLARPVRLRLLENGTTGTGVLMLRYEVDRSGT